MCKVHSVHLDFVSIPVHDPESVLLVETLEHGQRDLPVDLESSGNGILTIHQKLQYSNTRNYLVIIKSAASPSAQVPGELHLGAVQQQRCRRGVQADPGLEALDLRGVSVTK